LLVVGQVFYLLVFGVFPPVSDLSQCFSCVFGRFLARRRGVENFDFDFEFRDPRGCGKTKTKSDVSGGGGFFFAILFIAFLNCPCYENVQKCIEKLSKIIKGDKKTKGKKSTCALMRLMSPRWICFDFPPRVLYFVLPLLQNAKKRDKKREK
jgi:hypothetical protein